MDEIKCACPMPIYGHNISALTWDIYRLVTRDPGQDAHLPMSILCHSWPKNGRGNRACPYLFGSRNYVLHFQKIKADL